MATLWADATIPAIDASQPGGITTGTWMICDVEMWITHFRYYRGNSFDSGPHTGYIFDSVGTILAQKTYASEATGIGWREQKLTSPLHVLANTPFLTAIFSANGPYEATSHMFDSTVTSGPLHGYAAASAPGGANGVFDVSGAAAFPASSFNNTSYFIDIVYQTTQPNDPPVADAGTTQYVAANTLVTLDGTGSSDDDGTVTGYTWRQISGPTVTLSSTTVAQPTFTSPGTATPIILLFGLVVTDNLGASSPEVTVVVAVDGVQTSKYQLQSGALAEVRQYRLVSGALDDPEA